MYFNFSDFNKKEMIFHYTNTKIGLENILNDKTLKLNPFKNSYDPYESREWNFSVHGSGESIKHDGYKRLPQINKKLNYALLNNYKVACFCTNNNGSVQELGCTGYGYGKPRMWAQYGESHKGIVFGFSKNKLITKLKQTYGESNIFANEITYDIDNKEAYSVSLKNEIIPSDDKIKEFISNHISRYKDDFFFRKFADYRDEDEFRIIVKDDKDDSPKYFNFGDCLKFVVVGNYFNEVYNPAIELLCQKIDNPIMKVNWNKSFAHLSYL